jgi:hypothetical protein
MKWNRSRCVYLHPHSCLARGGNAIELVATELPVTHPPSLISSRKPTLTTAAATCKEDWSARR